MLLNKAACSHDTERREMLRHFSLSLAVIWMSCRAGEKFMEYFESWGEKDAGLMSRMLTSIRDSNTERAGHKAFEGELTLNVSRNLN
jgi:hypothetical protein